MRKYLSFKRALSVLGFLLAVYFVYNLAYWGRTLPHVFFGQRQLGGMSMVRTRVLVEEEVGKMDAGNMTFETSGQSIEVAKSDLGIGIDREATVNQYLSFGRSGKLGEDLMARAMAPLVNQSLAPIYVLDLSKMAGKLDEISAKFERPAKDASIVYGEGGWQISKESEGEVVDKLSVISQIKRRLTYGIVDPVQLNKMADQPSVRSNSAEQALIRVRALSDQKIVLSFGYDKWSLAGDDLLKVLHFGQKGQPDGYALKVGSIVVKNAELAESQAPELEVNLDKDGISDFIEGIAKSVDRRTVDATLKFENGKVVEFTPAEDGQELDKTRTAELIENQVSAGGQEKAIINISLPVKVTRAKIANDEINTLGIKELIGRGVSYFAGSIPNRAYNVGLGASRLSGTLVKPGEIFSFNKSVGEVSGTTGYKQAYVISEGRTVLDDGGGICQVSTTVFRAALNAGLPIVARTAHAYRVGYYEQNGFKPGLDATVWAPAVDLQFKNDTDHAVLVQAVIDPASAKLQVDIYGTSDGRRVVMTDPVISNQQPAPPDKYQDDPTLPKGTTKQVDFAAAGATSVFTRKVYKGDNLIIDDVFRSNFRPWQAIYLVGTG